MLYEPSNVPRGTGSEPYCDGSNGGNCRPRPTLFEGGAGGDAAAAAGVSGTCSEEFLSRIAASAAASSDDDVATGGSTAASPTGGQPAPLVEPTPSPASEGVTSGAQFHSYSGLALSIFACYLYRMMAR